MRPNDPTNQPSVHVPSRPQAGISAPTRQQSTSQSQQAAANLTRSQLDNIYENDPTHTATQRLEDAPSNQPVSQSEESANPYQRTHSDENLQAQPETWQRYHSAWQQYYQQYFYRYYAGHLQQTQAELERHKAEVTQLAAAHAASPAASPKPQDQEITPEEALGDIRARLRQQVSGQATKVRKSRHFVPIVAALSVMLVFLFLQYNRVLLANVEAYVSPGAIQPTNIIVDPNVNMSVAPEPRLIIPKINVDVPVVWDARPDHDSQMAAMANGVAWFGIPGANSKPGQVGNTVLSGHSSSDWLDSGDYKFIFARLEQMNESDTIYINYQSKRYTYKITKKEVVAPNNVQALIYETDKPVLTLITCVPLGTANNRLLVTAEQISPDPQQADAKPESNAATDAAAMPGQSPTFVERLFGRR